MGAHKISKTVEVSKQYFSNTAIDRLNMTVDMVCRRYRGVATIYFVWPIYLASKTLKNVKNGRLLVLER